MSVPENVASISGIVLFNGNVEAAQIVANEIRCRVENIRNEDSASVVTEVEEDSAGNSSVLKFCVVDVSDLSCLSVVRDVFQNKTLLKEAILQGVGSCFGNVVVAHMSMIGVGAQGPRVEVFHVGDAGGLSPQLQVTEEGNIDFYRNPDVM
jgi:hypothetical protein